MFSEERGAQSVLIKTSQEHHNERSAFIWLSLLKIENLAKNHIEIIFSEIAGPIGPKLGMVFVGHNSER
jgi:hypothetical protein